MPQGGLSNIDIDNILGQYEMYGGCMSKNHLRNKNPREEKYYVINSESSNQGDKRGAHWQVFSNVGKDTLFFDSFGCEYPPKVVKDFAKRAGKKIMTSDSKFQSDDSNACGNFCILVCLMIEKGYSPKRIVEKELPKLIPNYIDLDPSQ